MNPLRCDEVRNSLLEYLEFELPLTDREHFYEHLTSCAKCRVTHDELLQVLTDVKSIGVVYPAQAYWDGLAGNVLEEVKHLQLTAAQVSADAIPDSEAMVNYASHSANHDGKVIVFSRIKDRKRKAAAVHSGTPAITNIQQVTPGNEKKAAARLWSRIALPAAAAVLMGIAVVLSLLEENAVIIQDNIGFQAQIQSEKSLAELAEKIAPLSLPGNQFGFAQQKALFNEFSIGSMFSEAKAYAHAGQSLELKTHLALLKTALLNEADSQRNIIDSVSRLQLQLETQLDFAGLNRELTRLLNEYAAAIKEQDSQRYSLVKAGAWLFDFALSVLAQDDVSIVKQSKQLAQLATALRATGAPPGVIKSLNKIQDIVKEPASFTQSKYQQILNEVENIRSLLG
ncbi:MAG: zf-HC2 domain-containing protein [Gammaproteobacteria bacterium]|nr:zf-HC2 domain-containing protein [Gammaproteobacteria bacterium]